MVWNLPGWSLGFTTALELVGDYRRAVSYVCKYIGKQQAPGEAGVDKPGGRWYCSGGELERPRVELADLDPWEVRERPGARVIEVPEAGAVFVLWWDDSQVTLFHPPQLEISPVGEISPPAEEAAAPAEKSVI